MPAVMKTGVPERLGDLQGSALGALAGLTRVGARALTMRQLFADLDGAAADATLSARLSVHRDKVDAARTGEPCG